MSEASKQTIYRLRNQLSQAQRDRDTLAAEVTKWRKAAASETKAVIGVFTIDGSLTEVGVVFRQTEQSGALTRAKGAK